MKTVRAVTGGNGVHHDVEHHDIERDYIHRPVPGLLEPDGPILVNLGDIPPEQVDWIWKRRIARGKVGLFIGESGAGKTRCTLDISARVTRGLRWPDADSGTAPKGDVIILSSEDALGDTLRPIIDQQGGDAHRVHILRAVRIGGKEHAVNLERDLAALEIAIQERDATLVIISPLSSYLGGRDSYKDSDIRSILDPLAALAERRRVAVLGILHLTKAQQSRVLNRAQGSVAFVAVARTVLAVFDDRDNPGRRIVASAKNNLAQQAPALAFRITDAGVVWESDAIAGTAEQLMAVDDEPPTRSERRERDEAAQFLRHLLAEGPVSAKEVYSAAKGSGIAQRTLWRAKTDLGIEPERARTVDGRTAGWYWSLPVAKPDEGAP
jgi:putative DNA primase/helicase